MNRYKEILLSTTSSLEGWKVKDYYGPVSAQIVAGTGIFSDIAASLSDIFGGRSESYRKQLSAINKEVLNGLRREAFDLGANCVIGLRVDHDELSGKGKQMLMVTASGTAVFIQKVDAGDKGVDEMSIPVSADELETEITRSSLLRLARNSELVWNETTWSFVTKHRAFEFVEFLIRRIVSGPVQGEPSDEQTGLRDNAIDFMCSVPRDMAIEHIYPVVIAERTPPRLIYEIISEASLIDLEQVRRILAMPNAAIQKRALRILDGHLPSYTEPDVRLLEKLVAALKTAFAETCSYQKKKKMLSSKSEEFWICEAGHQNHLDDITCQQCGIDRNGFRSDEPKPSSIIPLLMARVKALKTLFPSVMWEK